MPVGECPFCSARPGRLISESLHASAWLDNFPVTEGHTLIVPRRHVTSLFDLDTEELGAFWGFLCEVRMVIVQLYGVSNFNVGLNDGPAAGQTVGHAHVHLIPRRPGDVPDPRGGVRWVIPERARYW